MRNSADPDQLADLDLHCLLRQGMSRSAREGLHWFRFDMHIKKNSYAIINHER